MTEIRLGSARFRSPPPRGGRAIRFAFGGTTPEEDAPTNRVGCYSVQRRLGQKHSRECLDPMIGGTPSNRQDRRPRSRIPNALSPEASRTLGLERGWLGRFPHELSCGELQRVALARALGQTTRYLLLDEITTMLDALTQASIWHFLRRIVGERNVGVLAISHDNVLLERVAHRVMSIESSLD